MIDALPARIPGVPSTIIRIATEQALLSQGVGAQNHARLGAVLHDRAHVYAAKPNGMKTHPFLARHTPWPFLHAETACLLAHGLDHCRGLDLAVVRINRAGTRRLLARPCRLCEHILTEAGIRRVTFSTDNGFACLTLYPAKRSMKAMRWSSSRNAR